MENLLIRSKFSIFHKFSIQRVLITQLCQYEAKPQRVKNQQVDLRLTMWGLLSKISSPFANQPWLTYRRATRGTIRHQAKIQSSRLNRVDLIYYLLFFWLFSSFVYFLFMNRNCLYFSILISYQNLIMQPLIGFFSYSKNSNEL